MFYFILVKMKFIFNRNLNDFTLKNMEYI
jgi:hypothetical protein